LPSRPPRPCTTPGCPGSAEYRGRCAAHSTAANRERFERNNQDFYNSPAWKRMTRMVAAEEPLCRECLKVGLVEAGTQTDHIIPIKIRPDLKLSRDNCQRLCDSHHSQKTALESGWTLVGASQ
jgi:5-methylcytosine-specific restriction protein A